MNPDYLFTHFDQALVYVATKSPVVVPFWAAVGWLIVLITRQWALSLICQAFGVRDEKVKKAIVSRIDVPFQLFLITIAFSPFLKLVPGGASVVKFSYFVAALLALHVFVQALDLVVFRWYLMERQSVSVPVVFRFVFMLLIYLVLLLWLLDLMLNVNVLPLLATSTVIAAVIGLALQDTLRNIVAGLTLSFEHSLREGDWVKFRISDRDYLIGQILEIGWRSTKIRTSNNNSALIPNSQFTSYTLVNYNAPSTQQACQIVFPVSTQAQPVMVRSALEKAATGDKNVLPVPKPKALPIEISQASVSYQLEFWIDGFEKKDQIVGEVMERGWQKLAEIGALASQ